MATKLVRAVVILAALLITALSFAAEGPLTVTKASPQGEAANLQQANEIRVTFSEPMVALGKIPETVVAPFFKISPPLEGSFRWSGTNILIFTPTKKPLPFATKYEVTVDATATSVAGKALEKPYVFTFTTPTVKLLRTDWYRQSGLCNSPAVILLHFNQPVRPEDAAANLALEFQPHEKEGQWTAPSLPQEALERLRAADPKAVEDFQFKLAQTLLAVRAKAPVPFELARDWNKKDYPPEPTLVVLVTKNAPPTDAWIKVRVAPGIKGLAGPETPGKSQVFTVQMEPTFFVTGLRCSAGCDPESSNYVDFRGSVDRTVLLKSIKVSDITEPAKEAPLTPKTVEKKAEAEEGAEGEGEGEEEYPVSTIYFDDLGFTLAPARSYAVVVGRDLKSADGQTLGYTWANTIQNSHTVAFTSFESGHGVWEASGGPQLPFSARNLKSITQWVTALKVEDLAPTIKRLEVVPTKPAAEGEEPEEDYSFQPFSEAPPVQGVDRTLKPVPDVIQDYGLNLKAALSPQGTGLVWAAVQEGEAIPNTYHEPSEKPKASLVQVTNLGLSVKDSPENTLIFVAKLDTAEPVEGARVTIRTLENKVFWTGTTDKNGLALADNTPLRNEEWWKIRFVVTAEKDGDAAYVCSNWNEGIEHYMFGLNYDLEEAKPILRGKVFADRGVYKLGEEVHLKAVLRSDTAKGMTLLPPGTPLEIILKDSQGEELDKRTLPLNDWSACDWTFTVPEGGALGNYRVEASVKDQNRAVYGSFLVAAYRRPDFRVDANLGAETPVAGVTLKGVVTGRYLFGAPMAKMAVKWVYFKDRVDDVPKAIKERFPEERYVFLGYDEDSRREGRVDIEQKETALDANGQVKLDLETDLKAGVPYSYTLEGEVTDVTRQVIAGRASFLVHPAPWYVGLKQPDFFVDIKNGVNTEVVAAALNGTATPGVKVVVTLTQVQWHSVRRAEGNGFYTWECERREEEKGRFDVVTEGAPKALNIPVPAGGYYILKAVALDAEGRSTTTTTSFYAIGAGYTAWARYDHNRIDLVPEKKTYKPGDTARILIKSPWEKATGLLTTEREGVKSSKVFTLTSTQQTVSVPIAEGNIPNVYVSVLLVKGRTEGFNEKDTSDPGKPSFRLGYTELKVEDTSKRLDVQVKADREEYKPAAKAKVEVAVKDGTGKPDTAEVTLWAVDYGVLSLTAYKTPSLLESVWIDKAIQVLNEDSRQRIISRRVITPKGADEGGGGGLEEGPGTPVRKDFRVLAFWLGSVVTDARGLASTEVTLPESLTTYRIMAVAHDRESRFGWGQKEIRVSKPVLLRAAFPRFLALGDKAFFGAVVNSQLKEKGTALVTIKSLDPGVLEVTGEPKQTLDIPAGGSAEARFNVVTRSVGKAKIQMAVQLLGEADAFEEVLPVEILVTPEVVAAYGQAKPEAKEALEIPQGVVPTYGGLTLELSSTSMVGLGEGARFLVDYPYGCAEQRASCALALVLAGDLGGAFSLPGIDPDKLKEVTQKTLTDLEAYQCENGGFVYWKGGSCAFASPYLTSYVLHVCQRAKSLGYAVNDKVLQKGYGFLSQSLNEPKPVNEGWWPAYTAWQAFAAKVLAEGGVNVDSHVTRLYGYADRMPIFGLAYLYDAMAAKGEKGERALNLNRRLTNGILQEAGASHVEELNDPYLLWYWNSNVRSTGLVLGSIVRNTSDESLVPSLVRWLMQVRKKGRWGNTQENAIAMESLVDYYRKYEKEIPDFTAVATLGLSTLATETFKGRSSEANTTKIGMRDLLTKGQPGQRMDLGFKAQGTGTLFYVARLKYAADQLFQTGMDQGFKVERSYALSKESGEEIAGKTYKAGDLVKITLKFTLPKERRFVAVTDPIPAGFEPVESWFATTSTKLAQAQVAEESQDDDWTAWWKKGGFDHIERHDDRVLLFATRLSEGDHVFSYVCRATTAGTFRTAPAHVEEMYTPEIFGRTATDVVEVKP